jgi:hypothetical protein
MHFKAALSEAFSNSADFTESRKPFLLRYHENGSKKLNA